MNEIITHLSKLGFSNNEARTYAALVELGEARAGRICEKTNIPSSHIYQILDSLTNKGVISFKILNNKKVYLANKPESLNILISDKKEELTNIEKSVLESISLLKVMPKNQETSSDYKYFEGLSGIKSLWAEFTEMLQPRAEILVCTGAEESFKEINDLYLEYHRQRVKKNVSERMILPLGAVKMGQERKKIGKIDIRYAKKQSDMEFIVYKDNVIIQYTREKTKPRAFMINDKIFSEGFKEIFEIMWKKSEEKP